MLLNYRRQYNGNDRQRQCVNTDGEQDGDVQTEMSFLQNQTVISGTDGITNERVKCFSCNRKGKYANECSDDEEVEHGVQILYFMTTNTHMKRSMIAILCSYKRIRDITLTSLLHGFCRIDVLSCLFLRRNHMCLMLEKDNARWWQLRMVDNRFLDTW